MLDDNADRAASGSTEPTEDVEVEKPVAITVTPRFPRDQLVRAQSEAPLLRERDEGGLPIMEGHFTPFNQWTEINSAYEGNFLERVSPGAFARTFKNNLAGMRVLFQHGRDPQIGDKPLGPITSLEEDKYGARYEVPLLDTSYNRDLLPGLQAGLYGASYRFQVLKEDMVDKPKRSDYNPNGLPERTITEAKVMEFGPVTFPAYSGASAGVRSMTDEVILERLATSGRLDELVDYVQATIYTRNTSHEATEEATALHASPAADSHTERRTRTGPSSPTRTIYGMKKETPQWLMKPMRG